MKSLKSTAKQHRKGNQPVVKHTEPETIPVGDSSRLPIDRRTRQPIAPMSQPGYYPDYHVLSQQNYWDEATRNVVLKRVNEPPPIRFFTSEQMVLMRAICDRLLPQDDRDEAHKIPIVNHIDERLYTGRMSGYRYEDMPPDQEAYILGLQAIEQIAQHMFGASFLNISPLEQDTVLKTLHDAEPPAAQEIWQKMSVAHFWLMILQDAVTAYYAHPYAWDEIGFGGPAYPRGYMRLEHGKPEPWESDEVRYDWEPPVNTLSGKDEPLGGPGGHKQQAPGQSGSH